MMELLCGLNVPAWLVWQVVERHKGPRHLSVYHPRLRSPMPFGAHMDSAVTGLGKSPMLPLGLSATAPRGRTNLDLLCGPYRSRSRRDLEAVGLMI
jgi:hypothetical protein